MSTQPRSLVSAGSNGGNRRGRSGSFVPLSNTGGSRRPGLRRKGTGTHRRFIVVAAVASLVGSVLGVVAFSEPAFAATPTFAFAGPGGGSQCSGTTCQLFDDSFNGAIYSILTVTDSNTGASPPYLQSVTPGTGFSCSSGTLPPELADNPNDSNAVNSTWPHPSSTKYQCLLTIAPGPATGDDTGVSGANSSANTVTVAETDSTGTTTEAWTFDVLPAPLCAVSGTNSWTGAAGTAGAQITPQDTMYGSPSVAEFCGNGANGPSDTLLTNVSTSGGTIFTGTSPLDTDGSDGVVIQANPGLYWTGNQGSSGEQDIDESGANTSGATWGTETETVTNVDVNSSCSPSCLATTGTSVPTSFPSTVGVSGITVSGTDIPTNDTVTTGAGSGNLDLATAPTATVGPETITFHWASTTSAPPSGFLTDDFNSLSNASFAGHADPIASCPPAPAMIEAGIPFCQLHFDSNGSGPQKGDADLDYTGQALPTTTTPTVALSSGSGSIGSSIGITDQNGACPATIGTGSTGQNFFNGTYNAAGTSVTSTYNCWYGTAGDGAPVSVTVGGVPATVTPNHSQSVNNVAVTNGANQVVDTAGFPQNLEGDNVSGAGIPPGTTVTQGGGGSAPTQQVITLSNNATATSAGETLTFTADVSGALYTVGGPSNSTTYDGAGTITVASVGSGSDTASCSGTSAGTATAPYSDLLGDTVTGTDIPAHTEVTNVVNSAAHTCSLTLSNNATATDASDTLTFLAVTLDPPQLNASFSIPAGVQTGSQPVEVCESTTPINGFDLEFGVNDLTPAGSLQYDSGSSGPTEICASSNVFVVAPTSTSTTVTDASNSSAWSGSEVTGSSAYDTSTVNGEVDGVPPTGTVSYTYWNDGDCGVSEDAAGTSAGSDLSLGTQSSTEGPLPEGTYSFQAVYSGDANYTGSTSPCESFSVGTASTSVATGVQDAANNSAWSGSEVTGSSAYDTSTVNGEVGGVAPTGTVSYTYWNDGDCGVSEDAAGTSAGSNLSLGTQSSTEGPLGAGSYSFQAAYSGDANYTGSTSPCEPFAVGAGSTSVATTATDASNSSAWSGSEVTGSSAYDTSTVNGEVDGVPPTGTVSYTYWTDADCGVSESAAGASAGSDLSLGTQSSTEGPLGAGSYSFQATYSGDANYSGATSPCEPFAVGTASTSVATTVDDAATNSAWSGSEVTGSSAYDTSTVNGEVGSVVPTGTVSYTYWTDGDCGVSESAAGTSAGSNLSLGTQSSTEGPLPDGSYSLQATYSGDANYSGSTSPCEPFSVGLTSTSVATTVEDATTNSTWSGSEVTGSSGYDTSTVNGEVGSIAPTGTVSYTYWTDADCGVSESAAGTSAGSNLSLGTQSSTEGPLPEGTYSFQATYSGDANYSGSTSPCESFSVGTAATSTTSTPTSSSIALGSSNTDGATVTGFGGGVDPTGPVTFYECGPTASAQPCTSSSWTQFDTESLSGSSNPDTVTSASFTPDATGTWCFAAVYSGDGNYTGSSDQGTDECFTVTGVGSSTTSSPSSSTAALDGPNSDNVVVTGADGASNAPYPTGHVTFYTCPEGVDPCTSANWTQLGSTVTLSTGEVNTNSATSADFTNDATGTWCFAAVYSGDGNYGGSSDQTSHECYTVAQASTTTISAPLNTTITEGQSNIDQATVYGNDADSSPPPPTGTVTFYQCGPTTTPTACTGGTQVGHPVNLTTSGSNAAAANSSAFTPTASPTAIGYWCFRAVYSGDGNYFTSSDDSSTNECFYVSGPLTITTASPLPQGTEHVHYSDQLQAVGGTGRYTWSKSGALPRGITLSSSGLLSGTPTRTGTFTFTAKVHDATKPKHEKATKSLSITIP
jgi:large repetitive protein